MKIVHINLLTQLTLIFRSANLRVQLFDKAVVNCKTVKIDWFRGKTISSFYIIDLLDFHSSLQKLIRKRSPKTFMSILGP